MRSGWGLLACIGLLLSPPPAWAQEGSSHAGTDESSPDDLIAKGVEHRRLGEDAEALVAFERAYGLHPSARAAAQIALAQQALGHWLEAERRLLEALRRSDEEPDRQWVARNRGYLEESLATVQDHLAWVDVDADSEGAQVWVQGQLCGKVPLEHPIRVVAGDVTVELRAAGREPMRQTLRLDPMSLIRVHLAFPPGTGESFARAGDRPLSARAGEPIRDRASSSRRTAGWIALVGAGGLALTGAAAQLFREWEVGIYNDDQRCGPIGGLSRYDRCGSRRDLGYTAQTIAVTSYAGAVLAGVGAGILLLDRPRSRSSRASDWFTCALGAGGIACDGSF